jgi:hypothetical protein
MRRTFRSFPCGTKKNFITGSFVFIAVGIKGLATVPCFIVCVGLQVAVLVVVLRLWSGEWFLNGESLSL